MANGESSATAVIKHQPTGLALAWYRCKKNLGTPTPYMMIGGIGLWLLVWWLFCEVWRLPRFEKMPGPVSVLSELFAREPFLGISIFTYEFYEHVWASCRRIFIAFSIATGVGVPLGLFMGWSKRFREFTFPLLETLRPIPILAWVPLAILMFPGFEGPVIFLATLASLYVTTLNTLLGVDSIDESYFRAAGCLGSKPKDVFWHVVGTGSLTVHLYRAADQHRRRLVLPGRRRDGVRRFRTRISYSGFLYEQRHGSDGDRDGDVGLRRLGYLRDCAPRG